MWKPHVSTPTKGNSLMGLCAAQLLALTCNPVLGLEVLLPVTVMLVRLLQLIRSAVILKQVGCGCRHVLSSATAGLASNSSNLWRCSTTELTKRTWHATCLPPGGTVVGWMRHPAALREELLDPLLTL